MMLPLLCEAWVTNPIFGLEHEKRRRRAVLARSQTSRHSRRRLLTPAPICIHRLTAPLVGNVLPRTHGMNHTTFSFILSSAMLALLSGCAGFMPPAQVPMVVAPAWQAPLPHQGSVNALSDWWQRQGDALLDACHKRARPIIMTTLAMGAGMLPIAVGWGAADASFRSPMAVAVIGGLMTSTVLSLLVIPAVFTVVDDFGNWVKRLVFRNGAEIDGSPFK